MTVFYESTVTGLYLVTPASTQQVILGFWLEDEIVESSSNLTLKETWQTQQGIYLFLKSPENINSLDEINYSQLNNRLGEFIRTPSLGNTRFLWIENPTDPVFRWHFYALSLTDSHQNNIAIVERLTFVNFRNYELAIAAGVTCQLNGNEDGFLFTYDSSIHNRPGGEIEVGKTAPFYFSTGYGKHRLKGMGETIALPLMGSLVGCFTFPLTLKNYSPGNQPFEELTQMEIGLRMFFKSANSELDSQDPFSGFAQLNTEQNFLISSHQYPFLDANSNATSHYSQQEDGSQNITLFTVLDPLQPLNSDRTYFTFLEAEKENISTLSFPSCYRTNLGYTIHVTPHKALRASQGAGGEEETRRLGDGETRRRGDGETGEATSFSLLEQGYKSLNTDWDSKLFFVENPTQSQSNFAAPFYLVPQGKYLLSVPNYETTPIPNGKDFPVGNEDNFLCGLAGIEYIKLSKEHLNILHLEPGKPALAIDFVPEQVTENDDIKQRLEREISKQGSRDTEAENDSLNDNQGNIVTTAWAYLEYEQTGNDFPTYFSQPKQSLLYRASTVVQDLDQDPTNDPLSFLEVPVTELPPQQQLYLPLFPYGGVTGKLTHYQQMEEQILNPQRRQQIRSLMESPRETPVLGLIARVTPQTTPTITGTTPQGLLATYESDDFAILQTLLLAKDTANQELNLQGLLKGTPLRSAFQSSQMFLIVSQSESLQGLFPDNQLTIQDWTFDLNPLNWRQGTGDSDTVLIFKFLDKPLLEILKDTALWEQPEIFVSNQATEIKTVRDRLVKFFADAIATVDNPNTTEKDRDNAAPLARIARSTFWSGMIALNVPLPAERGLPQELKALECGIQDGANFYAQYVGSNGTPVLPINGQLEAQQSSLFGLLDYQDTSVPKTGDSGYGFQVASLRVQFQNSQITAFSSEVNLTLDRLFDEATQLLNSRSGRNMVILKGFTEEHNGEITYAFSFSGENYFALPNSQILNNVDIVKATFSTDPPGSDSSVTKGRFTLWGRLNFRNLEAFDGLSFGSDSSLSDTVIAASQILNRSARALEDDYNGGIESLNAASENLQIALAELAKNEQFLQFSKLTLLMSCQHSNAAENITFSMDPSQISFDLARSKARPHSFYSKFPLKLINFVYLDPRQLDSQPKGYLPVKNPLGSNKMPTSGFGMNFELNLGNLGALGGAAQFVVNILMVWEPNQDNSQEKAQFFVGLRLPGIGGDVLGFPLQSVLKLSFNSLELLVDRTKLDSPAYLLKIKKVALKFFVLAFPPNGQTEIVIFGNPDATDSNNAVGWYAAYAKE